MAAFITGGTGKTGKYLAAFFHKAKLPYLVASRKGEAGFGIPATKFDWTDSTTFENPFKHSFANGEKISSVYIVTPEVADPVTPTNAFIDYAFEKYGVKKFVLLSASTLVKGGDYTGNVWQHLDDIGAEWTMVLASWFMENFAKGGDYSLGIEYENKIHSACGDGKIPFVGAKDIASLAFSSLSEPGHVGKVYRALGPELLTYDDIAAKLSTKTGRTITHVKLTEEESLKRLIGYGVPEEYANLFSSAEAMSGRGEEARTDGDVERVTGKAPATFKEWLDEHQDSLP